MMVGVLGGVATVEALADVQPTDLGAEEMQHLADVGVMRPFAGDLFLPNRAMDRASALVAVLRAGGHEYPTQSPDPDEPWGPTHDDVLTDQWYAPAVRYAGEEGIVRMGGNFRPSETVTKAEFLTMLFRATGTDLRRYRRLTYDLAGDIEAGDWYAQTFAYAKRYHIAHLPHDTLYRPHKPLTRREVAIFTHRQLSLLRSSWAERKQTEFHGNLQHFLSYLTAGEHHESERHLMEMMQLVRDMTAGATETESLAGETLSEAMEKFFDGMRTLKAGGKAAQVRAIESFYIAYQLSERVEKLGGEFGPAAAEFRHICEATITALEPVDPAEYLQDGVYVPG